MEVIQNHFDQLNATKKDPREKEELKNMEKIAMKGFGSIRQEKQAALFEEQLKKGLKQQEKKNKKNSNLNDEAANCNDTAPPKLLYDVTPYMKKQVQFGKVVGGTHLKLMQAECEA